MSHVRWVHAMIAIRKELNVETLVRELGEQMTERSARILVIDVDEEIGTKFQSKEFCRGRIFVSGTLIVDEAGFESIGAESSRGMGIYDDIDHETLTWNVVVPENSETFRNLVLVEGNSKRYHGGHGSDDGLKVEGLASNPENTEPVRLVWLFWKEL